MSTPNVGWGTPSIMLDKESRVLNTYTNVVLDKDLSMLSMKIIKRLTRNEWKTRFVGSMNTTGHSSDQKSITKNS